MPISAPLTPNSRVKLFYVDNEIHAASLVWGARPVVLAVLGVSVVFQVKYEWSPSFLFGHKSAICRSERLSL